MDVRNTVCTAKGAALSFLRSTADSRPVVILLLLALAGGGALYWFKLRKPKTGTKGPADLDDYDFGEAGKAGIRDISGVRRYARVPVQKLDTEMYFCYSMTRNPKLVITSRSVYSGFYRRTE